jgi:phage-related protein
MPGSSLTRLIPSAVKTLYSKFPETAGGTERVQPVITLTCDDTLTATTVIIENETTGEIFEWTGDLEPDDVLVIDCKTYEVTLNGVTDIGNMSGQFIHLIPGANSISVSGFTGNLNFTYRARYV